MPDNQPSHTEQAFGDFAPQFVDITDRVLFEEVWPAPGLSARDRSLVTVASLLTGGNTEQLRFHLPYARENGVTEPELIAAITHLAFYAGWPKAVSAMTVAKEVFSGPRSTTEASPAE